MTLEELESFRGDIDEMIKSKKDNTYNNKNIEEKQSILITIWTVLIFHQLIDLQKE